MKAWKAMFGKRMGATAMLVLLLTAVAGSRAEAGRLQEMLDGLRNGKTAEELRDEQLKRAIKASARAAGEDVPSDAQIDAQLEELRDEFDSIKKQIHGDASEEGKAAAGDAAENTTENAAVDPGASASEDYETSEEMEAEPDFNYENDINLVVMRNSEGDLIHIGPAFAVRGSGVQVYTESFGDEVASAFITTDEGSYDLDLDTVQVIDGTVAIWELKDSAPEDDVAFLDVAYPHQAEEATIVYYAWENEKMNIHAEMVILEDCDETGILTVDHLPENMMYPAVLVNRDGAFVGLVSEDGKIRSGVNQEIFYGR